MLLPKILIISNAAFSKTDSNGRTLENYFGGYNKSRLAQFFVYGTPDFHICENYYKVADRDALKSLFTFSQHGGEVVDFGDGCGNTPAPSKVIQKTPFKHLIRNFVWKFGRWKGGRLDNWIRDFDPDVIFVSLADSPFIADFARKTAVKHNIPVVVYSTEDYVLKQHNYINQKKSPAFWLFMKQLRKSYDKLMPMACCGVFNTPALCDAYKTAYGIDAYAVLPMSTVKFHGYSQVCDNKKISYTGNLGLDRHLALIEIARVLEKIDPGLVLDIYGSAPSQDMINLFESISNIKYHGFVSYEDVLRVMYESRLLIHAEKSDPYRKIDLKYAFSTKISDYVSSGVPMLLYAPKELAETDFVAKTGCGFTVSDGEQLFDVVSRALTDEVERADVNKSAFETYSKFFDPLVGRKKIEDIIIFAAKSKKA